MPAPRARPPPSTPPSPCPRAASSPPTTPPATPWANGTTTSRPPARCRPASGQGATQQEDTDAGLRGCPPEGEGGVGGQEVPDREHQEEEVNHAVTFR